MPDEPLPSQPADQLAEHSVPMASPLDAEATISASTPAEPANGAAALDFSPPPESPYEGAVPPGYDWPTHGGYLGCLMGAIAGCLVGAFFGANLFSFLWASDRVAGPIFILVALVVLLFFAWALGRLGWVLGKRFYRAYEQPARPVWGEDDAEVPGVAVESAALETESGEAARG